MCVGGVCTGSWSQYSVCVCVLYVCTYMIVYMMFLCVSMYDVSFVMGVQKY